MKTWIIAAMMLGFVATSVAQETDGTADDAVSPTQQGRMLIEANTGFGGTSEALGGSSLVPFSHTANTGFAFSTSDQWTVVAMGVEAGYFVVDNLALKFGFGFSNISGDLLLEDIQTITWKAGAKYYLLGMVPLQIDVTGSQLENAVEEPLWLGIQAGYAAFLTPSISLEPGLRVNQSLNDDFTDETVVELRLGFALLF